MTQPLSDEQLAAIRVEILSALSTAGAYCGECGFEPGEAGCPDCVRVRGLYADALMPIVSRRGAVGFQPAADDQLRDRIAEALMRWADGNHNPAYASLRRPETVTANARGRAEAVLAVVQPELDQLREQLERAHVGWRAATRRSDSLRAERDAALERLANYGSPLHGPVPAPSVDQSAIKKAAIRDELERTGVTPWEWAVGHGLCPARTGCPSGLLAVFQLTKRGRLPVHRGDYGPACEGSGQRPSVVLRAADPITT